MKYQAIIKLCVLGSLALGLCGCRAVYDANRADEKNLAAEGSIVFTRPAQFTPFFGSHSLSEFIEIVYERASRNSSGMLVVEVGIRNRGPVSWTNWDNRAPDRITLKTVCNFYSGAAVRSPVIYSTNRREIVIPRGETYVYRAMCPQTEAQNYQLVLGD